MIGCLLIHGFTGSPKELEPLADYLQHNGFAVFTPILKGHCTNRDELKKCNWQEWVESAESVLKEMNDQFSQIFIIGFSMGGLIAAHLASRYQVERLVLLSPAMFVPNYKQIWLDLRDGFRTKQELTNRFKGYLSKLKRTPISTIWQFRQLVKHLRNDLPHVHVPTLIIHGDRDDVVHPRSAKFIYDTISSDEKLLHFLPKSKHIVCHDEEAEDLKKLVLSFLPQ